MILLFAILIDFSPLAEARWDASLKRSAGSCTCFWDGSTKDYANSAPSGTLRKSVRYACGYICESSDGRYHRVKGSHRVSYLVENGDEVVCDGLVYQAQDTPGQDRMSIMVWDGNTWAFDPKEAASVELKDWGKRHCQNVGTTPTQFPVGKTKISEAQTAVGLARDNEVPKQEITFQPTPEHLKKYCTFDAQFAALASAKAEQKQQYGSDCVRGSTHKVESRLLSHAVKLKSTTNDTEAAAVMKIARADFACPFLKTSDALLTLHLQKFETQARRFGTSCAKYWWSQLRCMMVSRSQSQSPRAISAFTKDLAEPPAILPPDCPEKLAEVQNPTAPRLQSAERAE